MVLICGMAFILFDLERDTGVLALDPCDGHFARHRPVAGVLLDELRSSVAALTFDSVSQRVLKANVNPNHTSILYLPVSLWF